MDKQQIKNSLMEMFPELSSSQADMLSSTGDDINVLITRILDNNIDGPTIELKEIAVNSRSNQKYEHELNYPEVFKINNEIDMHQDVKSLRQRASKLLEEASNYSIKAYSTEFKECKSYYGIEADGIREQANEYNRQAAIILMRRAIESNESIDLHGLQVEEALAFVKDLYHFNHFKEIKLITGQKYKSLRIRPVITKWLIDQNFTVVDDGPMIRAFKNFSKF